MTVMNRQFRLVSYADGRPGWEHFELVEEPVPTPGEGELVVAARYFGMDPFPRLRMSAEGALPPLPLGTVMLGRGVGQVVASRHPEFAEGDFVAGELGWQTHALLDGQGLRPVDPAHGPISMSLGVLGPPGLAAYFALRQGEPQAGETVVISGAAGAVGSVAGQVARIWGCRAVGIADGGVKTGYLTRTLGLDAAVDYTATDDLAAAIGAVCPGGVDVFVDLVGGTMHDAVLSQLNVKGRAVLVGTIANYNEGGQDVGPRNLLQIITKRARVSGFLVHDYAAEFSMALEQLGEWLASGELVYKETIVEGFERLPEAFAGIFEEEERVGKFLVKV